MESAKQRHDLDYKKKSVQGIRTRVLVIQPAHDSTTEGLSVDSLFSNYTIDMDTLITLSVSNISSGPSRVLSDSILYQLE